RRNRSRGTRQQGAALLLLQRQGRPVRSGARPCVQRTAGTGDAGARKQTTAAEEDAGISGNVFRLHCGESSVSAGGAGGMGAVECWHGSHAAGREGILPSDFREAGGRVAGGDRGGGIPGGESDGFSAFGG